MNVFIHAFLAGNGMAFTLISFLLLLLLGDDYWFGLKAITAMILSLWWTGRMLGHLQDARDKERMNAWQRELAGLQKPSPYSDAA